MRKLLIVLLFVLCFVGEYQAKRYRSHREAEDQGISQHVKRSNRGNKDSQKPSRSSSNKKLKKHKPQLNHHQQQHQILHWNEPAFWWNTFLAIFLSCAGGFFSGMTVGLNSLDKLTLEVQQITGNQEEKRKASRILNTIKDHHLFLVTLLVGNAIVLEWLPLVVHKVMPDWAAILISTVAVVIVAEIVPMSYTTGPSKYEVAYTCAPLVDICIKIYYVIAYPVARGLDKLLGVHDDTHIKRRDFIAFINEKKKNYLKPLQITIFNQLFVGPQFTSVQKVMTSINEVMVLCMSDQITPQMIQQIVHSEVGFILIARTKHQAHNFNILTTIKTKEFVCSYLKKKIQLKKPVINISEFIRSEFVINPSDTAQASEKSIHGREAILKFNQKHRIPVVYSDTGLLDLLTIMRARECSVALVHKDIRRKQETNIAYLDATDQQVLYDPFSIQDKHSIIGVVFIDNVFQTIVDFNGQITPAFEKEKQVSPVKKRKLVKKASIVSAYSARSQRSREE